MMYMKNSLHVLLLCAYENNVNPPHSCLFLVKYIYTHAKYKIYAQAHERIYLQTPHQNILAEKSGFIMQIVISGPAYI